MYVLFNFLWSDFCSGFEVRNRLGFMMYFVCHPCSVLRTQTDHRFVALSGAFLLNLAPLIQEHLLHLSNSNLEVLSNGQLTFTIIFLHLSALHNIQCG